ncbi:TPA: hypothetical protein DDZ86_03230 [Candidatus Dependentiae bacterium]|nr:hypothetical protein [Candidatus Dependentiae bacterium]
MILRCVKTSSFEFNPLNFKHLLALITLPKLCLPKSQRLLKRIFSLPSYSYVRLKKRVGQSKSADQTLFHRALLILSNCLATHHGRPAVIVIDEYNSPIHEGYVKGYYQEIISFMRVFLGAGLKGNESLKMGVLTGILRVAKRHGKRSLP